MASRPGTGESGRSVLVRVRKAVAGPRGWPAGLTVLTGDDLFHLDAVQAELLHHLVPADAHGYALTVLGDEPVGAGEVVAAARSVGMFSPRRVVLLRDPSALILDSDRRIEAACDAFKAYADNPPEASHLIVRAPRLDVRRRFHKLLAGLPGTLRLEPAEGQALIPVLHDIARERGLGIDDEVAELLVEAGGGDLHRIVSELDKLRTFLGPDAAGEVTLGQALEVAAGGSMRSGFLVADAIAARDGKTALETARSLLDGGEEPLRLLGAVSWRARMLVQAKAMLEAGARPQDVVVAVRAFRGRDALLQGLRRYRMDELLAFPSRLLQADRTLKSRSLDGRAVIESLIDDLVAP
jgi:DNA polymerase-3 subunit delta